MQTFALFILFLSLAVLFLTIVFTVFVDDDKRLRRLQKENRELDSHAKDYKNKYLHARMNVIQNQYELEHPELKEHNYSEYDKDFAHLEKISQKNKLNSNSSKIKSDKG